MKVLILRFSSIGDIVLTTPVIRMVKKQTGAKVHFLTRKKFTVILSENPYIDKLISFENNLGDSISTLKEENYDYIIDLQHNLRSLRIKLALRKPSRSFFKSNIEKWLMVNFKIDLLPKKHIVNRLLDTVKDLRVTDDGEGLDFHYIRENGLLDSWNLSTPYVCLSLGGAHVTKQMPLALLEDVIEKVDQTVVLLGGPDVSDKGQLLARKYNQVINTCGMISLFQSAQLIDSCSCLITGDTGIMHIGAALRKPLVTVWGNTIPGFGMYPYFGKESIPFSIIERDLNCRPCSKTGFNQCPRKHFHCMLNITGGEIISALNELKNS